MAQYCNASQTCPRGALLGFETPRWLRLNIKFCRPSSKLSDTMQGFLFSNAKQVQLQHVSICLQSESRKHLGSAGSTETVRSLSRRAKEAPNACKDLTELTSTESSLGPPSCESLRTILDGGLEAWIEKGGVLEPV